ncbi:MAG: ABC transporter ATP-binding protein [Spirochaetota bacterium]
MSGASTPARDTTPPGGASTPARDATPPGVASTPARGVSPPGVAENPGRGANNPALDVREVTAGYPERPGVIREVSFEAGRGGVVALLGPNGAGKTTLLNVCLGWHRPADGAVWLLGDRLSSLPRGERGRRISLVPQIDYVPFEYSVLEYVLLGRAPYLSPLAAPDSRDVERAREELSRLGIAELSGKSVVATSAGERALILVARALVQEADVILMDEPSAHLDLKNKRLLIDLIHKLRDTGKSIVLTAHEPEFADAVASHIVLLAEGTVLMQGPPDAVLTGEMLSSLYETSVTVHRSGSHRFFSW